jgi:hypothetical protein
VVALVGAAAVLGAAVLANWDKLFGGKAPEPASASASGASAGPAQAHATTLGTQSPVVSGVSGNVSISIGGTSATPSPFAGHWEARIEDSDGEFLGAFDIEVADDVATGSALLRGEQSELIDGKVSGNTLTFRTRGTGPDGAAETRRHRGLMQGQRLQFTMEIEDPDPKHKRVVEFTATR